MEGKIVSDVLRWFEVVDDDEKSEGGGYGRTGLDERKKECGGLLLFDW